MRVLFFAYYFPPMGGMGSIRALSFVRHLPREGVDVTVVAPRTGTYGLDPSLEPPPSARIVRTGTLEPTILLGRGGQVGGVGRGPGGSGGTSPRIRNLVHKLLHVPDPNIGWVPAAVSAGLRTARRWTPDVILSSSPPLSAHVAAAVTASRLRKPLVIDVRDFLETQRLHRGLRDRLDRLFEDRVLRRAAGFVAPTDGILEDLRRRVRRPSLLVRNGYEETDFEGPAPDLPERFRLVHVGTTYGWRKDPAAFFRAV
ncbi:MAG: glycosyltransferase, partial [Planctomycetota bacterium]